MKIVERILTLLNEKKVIKVPEPDFFVNGEKVDVKKEMKKMYSFFSKLKPGTLLTGHIVSPVNGEVLVTSEKRRPWKLTKWRKAELLQFFDLKSGRAWPNLQKGWEDPREMMVFASDFTKYYNVAAKDDVVLISRTDNRELEDYDFDNMEEFLSSFMAWDKYAPDDFVKAYEYEGTEYTLLRGNTVARFEPQDYLDGDVNQVFDFEVNTLDNMYPELKAENPDYEIFNTGLEIPQFAIKKKGKIRDIDIQALKDYGREMRDTTSYLVSGADVYKENDKKARFDWMLD